MGAKEELLRDAGTRAKEELLCDAGAGA